MLFAALRSSRLRRCGPAAGPRSRIRSLAACVPMRPGLQRCGRMRSSAIQKIASLRPCCAARRLRSGGESLGCEVRATDPASVLFRPHAVFPIARPRACGAAVARPGRNSSLRSSSNRSGISAVPPVCLGRDRSHRGEAGATGVGLQESLAAGLGQIAHPQDVALPLGHRNDAARVEQVEHVAGLDASGRRPAAPSDAAG